MPGISRAASEPKGSLLRVGPEQRRILKVLRFTLRRAGPPRTPTTQRHLSKMTDVSRAANAPEDSFLVVDPERRGLKVLAPCPLCPLWPTNTGSLLHHQPRIARS